LGTLTNQVDAAYLSIRRWLAHNAGVSGNRVAEKLFAELSATLTR
jgi:hypothetical protein